MNKISCSNGNHTKEKNISYSTAAEFNAKAESEVQTYVADIKEIESARAMLVPGTDDSYVVFVDKEFDTIMSDSTKRSFLILSINIQQRLNNINFVPNSRKFHGLL